MAKPIMNPEYMLYEKESRAFASSRQVAETFNRRHDDILRAIRNLGCSEEFNLRNFAETSYKDQWNRKQPEYLMTRGGFVLLAMGFTGKKAMAFKEAYIQRFNEMEGFIQSLAVARMEFPAFTHAVMEAHEEPKHYHFSNEINMIYRIIFGMDAKRLREERGIRAGESVRPYLSAYEIQAIEHLQRADIGFLLALPEYIKRREALQRYFEALQRTPKLLMIA